MPTDALLIIATLLFFCGIGGALSRRSILVASFSLLLAQSSGILIFVDTALKQNDAGGMARAILLILLCGGLFLIQGAVAIAIYRYRGSVNLDEFRELRG